MFQKSGLSEVVLKESKIRKGYQSGKFHELKFFIKSAIKVGSDRNWLFETTYFSKNLVQREKISC